MKRILIDVDTQIDFMDPTGRLYVPSKDGVVSNILSELKSAESNGDVILGCVDSHSYDSWEYQENGGPFPGRHCYKGTIGWTRMFQEVPNKIRFIPMTTAKQGILCGGLKENEENRKLEVSDLVNEAVNGVGLYFEKEVYSLFSNQISSWVLTEIVNLLGGNEKVLFDIIGFCTGGYCVDSVALGLKSRGYKNIRILSNATSAIGGEEGEKKSKKELTSAGICWI